MNEHLLRTINCINAGGDLFYFVKLPHKDIRLCYLNITSVKDRDKLRIIYKNNTNIVYQIRNSRKEWIDIIIGESAEEVREQIIELIHPDSCYFTIPTVRAHHIETPLFTFDLKDFDSFKDKMKNCLNIDVNKEDYEYFILKEEIKDKQEQIIDIQQEIDELQKEIDKLQKEIDK